MIRVLLIDGEPAPPTNPRDWLVGRGFAAESAAGAQEGIAAAAAGRCDVVVIDVPVDDHLDGIAVCARLRREGVGTPILLLSARDAVADRVRGLESGADDYLVKPFALLELGARIRALARRHLADRSVMLRLGDVELDTTSRAARVGGEPVDLTEKETDLLELLLAGRNRPQSHSAIAARVWAGSAPASNLIDVYAGRLRRKLAGAGSRVTVLSRKRQGYVLGTRRAQD